MDNTQPMRYERASFTLPTANSVKLLTACLPCCYGESGPHAPHCIKFKSRQICGDCGHEPKPSDSLVGRTQHNGQMAVWQCPCGYWNPYPEVVK